MVANADNRAATSLARARWAKSYSREYVARQLAISAKTVERHEKGERRIKPAYIAAYAALYDVPIESLADMAVAGASVANQAA